jgi:hypothetical protein
MVRFGDVLLGQRFKGSLDRADCLRVFTEHNEAVQQHVPADRLLVFRVTEGWEPLCKFLGCDVPDGIPFPHLNEGDQTIKALMRQIFLGPWLRRVLVPALGLGVLAWWLL